MHFEIECCEMSKEMLGRIWWMNFLKAPSARWLMLFLLLVTISAITSFAFSLIRSGSFSSPYQVIVDFNFSFLGIKQLQYFWENHNVIYSILIFSYRQKLHIKRIRCSFNTLTWKTNWFKLQEGKPIWILSWIKSTIESFSLSKSSSGIFW